MAGSFGIGGLFNTNSFYNTGSNSVSFSSNFSSNVLGDYAAIRNGSYKKLLKSYYAEKNNTSSKTGSTGSDLTSTENKQVTSMASDMSALKNAADALKTTGKNSLFKEGENGVDMDKLYDAAKTLVDAYNSAMASTEDISIPVVDRKLGLTENMMVKNSKLLSSAGIEFKDGKLTINEDKFKSADVNTLKTLFNGAGSVSDKLSSRAGDVYNVTQAILGNKATTYSRSATFNPSSSFGNLVDTTL